MKIIGSLLITRLSLIKPGELFLLIHEVGVTPCLMAIDPIDDTKLYIPLDKPCPSDVEGPKLRDISSGNTLSFGRDFILRLPCDPAGWQRNAPNPRATCFVSGEEGVFLRANVTSFGAGNPGYCYVDVRSGEIQANREIREYLNPKGSHAFAIKWEILTDEEVPRLILSYG